MLLRSKPFPPRAGGPGRGVLGLFVGALALLAAPFACTPSQLGASGGGGQGAHAATGGAGGSGGCVTPGDPCAVQFTLPLANQHTVELRGDFAPDGWTKGVPMSLDGEQWTASIDAKDGQSIQ